MRNPRSVTAIPGTLNPDAPSEIDRPAGRPPRVRVSTMFRSREHLERSGREACRSRRTCRPDRVGGVEADRHVPRFIEVDDRTTRRDDGAVFRARRRRKTVAPFFDFAERRSAAPRPYGRQCGRRPPRRVRPPQVVPLLGRRREWRPISIHACSVRPKGARPTSVKRRAVRSTNREEARSLR
jgi:hypothetical protein